MRIAKGRRGGEVSHSLRRPNSFVKLSDGGLVLVFQDALMFGLREHGFDGFYQLARRLDTQLDRYPGSRVLWTH